jgi:hypothetical protein
MNDLKGKRVGTDAVYVTALQREYPEIEVVSYVGANTNEEFASAQTALLGGDIAAFVFDVVGFTYRISALPNPCQYLFLTDPSVQALKFTYGFVFNSHWNMTDYFNLQLSLFKAQEAAVDVQLNNKYVGTLPECVVLTSQDGVTFMQLSGLFLIVGVVTAACIVAGIGVAIYRVRQAFILSSEEGTPAPSMRSALSKVFKSQTVARATGLGDLSARVGSLRAASSLQFSSAQGTSSLQDTSRGTNDQVQLFTEPREESRVGAFSPEPIGPSAVHPLYS